jgi:type VI secretion system secreted protein VgrG
LVWNKRKGTTMSGESKWTQANRAIEIMTPLGKDVLLLRAFQLVEELGRPFSIKADLRSTSDTLDFDKLVGANVTIRVTRLDGKEKFLNGFVARIAHTGISHRELYSYSMTIVPWLVFLKRTQDCRIFQEKTVPEIIQAVFKDFGFTEFKLALSGTYEKREYVVQYRETAFDFVSRLMEDEGIYYFFEYENGKHTMIIADSPSAHETVEGFEKLRYNPEGSHEDLVLDEWKVERSLQPGRYVLNDFDFKAPAKALLFNTDFKGKHAAAEFEVFDYPGGYTEVGQGKQLVKARGDELACQRDVVLSGGASRGLHAGAKFTADNVTAVAGGSDFVIVRQAMTAQVSDYDKDPGPAGKSITTTDLTLIPALQQFRPSRITEWPQVGGPQTAIVCGAAGEEIHTDEWGRVKVKFHWDRYSKADETSSCWIRVSQAWAGAKWGAIFTPRVGQEVIVDFLEGNPDRPIITGRVYNNANMPPYALPANKTISTNKSSSSKDGKGFNEIRFEDKAGEEQIFIHAQKNMDIRVLADCFETIKNDRALIVEHDQMELVKNDRSEKVEGHHKEHVVKDFNLKVEGKQAIEVTGTLSESVADDVIEVYKANQSTSVAAQLSIKADIIALEAATNITLKVGGSYIAIDSSSINIKTTNLTIETDADTKITATANFDAKGTAGAKLAGAKVDIKADGVGSVEAGGALTVKGATTMVG